MAMCVWGTEAATGIRSLFMGGRLEPVCGRGWVAQGFGQWRSLATLAIFQKTSRSGRHLRKMRPRTRHICGGMCYQCTAYLGPAHRLGTFILFLFLHMHRGGPYVGLEGYTCIPETVTISAVLAGW